MTIRESFFPKKFYTQRVKQRAYRVYLYVLGYNKQLTHSKLQEGKASSIFMLLY